MLRKSFVRTTVPSNVMALQADLNDRILKYNNKETEEDPAKQVKEIPLRDAHLLNPIFETYCQDVEQFFRGGEASDDVAEKYADAFDEYMFMKRRQSIELQILEANRVGVDKNLASIIKNTASHVGLQMPKQFEDPKKD